MTNPSVTADGSGRSTSLPSVCPPRSVIVRIWAVPLAVAAAVLVPACATTPHVTYRYYPSQSETIVTLTQTISCSQSAKAYVVVNRPEVTTLYSADHSEAPYELPVRSLARNFSDSDIKADFSKDGRLLSINATTTGQGTALVESAINLATSLATVAIPSGLSGQRVPDEKKEIPECMYVKDFGGDARTVVLTYGTRAPISLRGAVPSDKSPNPPVFVDYDLPVYKGTEQLYSRLKRIVGTPKVRVHRATKLSGSASHSSPSGSQTKPVLLKLRETADVKVEILIDGAPTSAGNVEPIFAGNVIVPGWQTYDVPIPRAKLFGKQTFTLTLSEAGAITNIGYTGETGIPAALNAATAVTTAVSPQTAEEQAAEAMAQANLIVQQQRLARCLAQPSECQ